MYSSMSTFSNEYNEYKNIMSARKNELKYTSTMYSSHNPVLYTCIYRNKHAIIAHLLSDSLAWNNSTMKQRLKVNLVNPF